MNVFPIIGGFKKPKNNWYENYNGEYERILENGLFKYMIDITHLCEDIVIGIASNSHVSTYLTWREGDMDETRLLKVDKSYVLKTILYDVDAILNTIANNGSSEVDCSDYRVHESPIVYGFKNGGVYVRKENCATCFLHVITKTKLHGTDIACLLTLYTFINQLNRP